MSLLFLARHGLTQYNQEQRFCGWRNIPLSPQGQEQAEVIGQSLKQYRIDEVFTSDLQRSIETAKIILTELNQSDLNIQIDPRIKERNYGVLSGFTHLEIEAKYSQDQVKKWRRSWSEKPPEGESLADVYQRVVDFYQSKLIKKITESDINVLLVAHGNSLRALIKFLDQISDQEIVQLEIVYDQPYVYQIDSTGKVKKLDHIPRVARVMAK